MFNDYAFDFGACGWCDELCGMNSIFLQVAPV
jgi:hypothetical protein